MTASGANRSQGLPPELRGPVRLGDNRVYRPYLGGSKIAEFVGGVPEEDAFFPEDWVGSDTVAAAFEDAALPGVSRLRIGGEEVLLSDLLRVQGEEILGPQHIARFGPRSAVLVKLLDSAERLAIQSHPSAEFVRRHLGGEFGKAESWFILGTREIAGEKPYVLYGWKEDMDAAEFAQAIRCQDIAFMESRMHRFEVERGQLFHLPAAMPHALGPGCFLVEVQEPSDWVFFPEFPKETSESGEKVALPMELCCMRLPLETAIESMRLEGISREEIIARFLVSDLFDPAPGVRTLLSVPEFRVQEIVGDGRQPLTVEERSFAIAIGESGELALDGEGFETVVCRRGDRLLIPWSLCPFQVSGEGRLIVARPPVAST